MLNREKKECVTFLWVMKELKKNKINKILDLPKPIVTMIGKHIIFEQETAEKLFDVMKTNEYTLTSFLYDNHPRSMYFTCYITFYAFNEMVTLKTSPYKFALTFPEYYKAFHSFDVVSIFKKAAKKHNTLEELEEQQNQANQEQKILQEQKNHIQKLNIIDFDGSLSHSSYAQRTFSNESDSQKDKSDSPEKVTKTKKRCVMF